MSTLLAKICVLYFTVYINIDNDFVYLDLNSENIQREINVTHDIGEPYFVDENVLARNLMMNIDLKISDIVEGDTLELCVNLKIEGGFCIDESGTDEELIDLIEVSGTAALYSIARGVISSITSQTCTNGTILLPMINMFEMKRQLDSEDRE